MSVASCFETYKDRGGVNTDEALKVTRSFDAITTSASDDALVVLAHPTLPVLGAYYPSNSGLLCSSISARPTDVDGVHWVVTAEYAPPAFNAGEITEPNKAPWQYDPVIRFGNVAKQQVMEKCYQFELDPVVPIAKTIGRGVKVKSVTNSLLMPYDPPAMFEEYLLAISISRNVKLSDFSPDKVYKYQNTINKTMIWIAGVQIKPWEGYINSYTADKAWWQHLPSNPQGTPYYQENITVVVDPATWIRKLVDNGMFTATTGGTYYDYTPIKDVDGKKITEPVLLDGHGERNPPANDPVYFNYHVLWEEIWDGLDLPDEA